MSKYYETVDGGLIQKSDKGVYRLKTQLKGKTNVISEEEFAKLITVSIKQQRFATKMNAFFKAAKEEWEWNGTLYRKIDNFEVDGQGKCTNYKLGSEVPFHETPFKVHCVIVYHWGKVYYHTVQYNGYRQGQLYTMDGVFAQWCQLKHCAPIFNTETKIIA